jgi:hypothetical protein
MILSDVMPYDRIRTKEFLGYTLSSKLVDSKLVAHSYLRIELVLRWATHGYALAVMLPFFWVSVPNRDKKCREKIYSLNVLSIKLRTGRHKKERIERLPTNILMSATIPGAIFSI